MNAITVKNLSKKFRIPHEKKTTLYENILGLVSGGYGYDEFWALKDVSFEVKKGETFGVIGDNGSGKTTLLAIIANVLRADSGECEVNGKIAPFLGLGVGFENDLTAKENVYLYGSIMGLSRREIKSKYDEIVEFSELEKFMDLKLKNFSSGMYMRLAFSVAISVDPDILLIDEILAVGDVTFQKKCIDRIMELKNNKKTIVFVSHNIEQVKNLCNRCMLIRNGEVERVGNTEEVINRYYRSLYVRENPIRINPGKDVFITKVEILDKEDKPCQRFKTGGYLKVKVHYEAEEEIKNPNFAVAIHTLDQTYCYGITSNWDQTGVNDIKGLGSFEVSFYPLNLLSRSYEIVAAIFDNYENIIDKSDKHYFTVKKDINDQGLVFIEHKWGSINGIHKK